MDYDIEFVRQEYKRIRATAYQLAGDLDDLPHRASVYHHLYQDSEGRCVFPLIAAHAALWANGYFAKGMQAGKILALPYLVRPALWRKRTAELNAFADAFRDINRRICAETYCAYYFTKQYGETAFAQTVLPRALLKLLNQCHLATRQGVAYATKDRRRLFHAFVMWEQEATVSPAVDAAFAALDWGILKWFAMRTKVEFSYFQAGAGLQSKAFAEQRERVRVGILAFERAEAAGYTVVENALADYRILPRQFLLNSRQHFFTLLDRVAGGTA